MVTAHKFHKDFFLNGKNFSSDIEILNYAEKLNQSIYTFLSDWFNDSNVVDIQTSGSTGKPKTISLKKEHMINSALATGTFFDLAENTKTLLCLSTDYIAGKMMLIRALTLGWQLDIVLPNSTPLKGIDTVYDFCAMVPLQVQNSLSELPKIKKLIVGGGVVSNELFKELQKIPTHIYATYGMTETCTHIAVKKLNNFRHAELVSASHYEVFPNINTSKDTRGCLVINAPHISDNRIVTNDLVELVSHAEFEWLGRYDTIINSGGIKLIPEQIEKKLEEIIPNRFFVAGIHDEKLGEKMILIIEDDKNEIATPPLADRNDLNIKISNLKFLHKYEIPKEIYFVKQFVETETKKIQRQQTLDLIFKK